MCPFVRLSCKKKKEAPMMTSSLRLFLLETQHLRIRTSASTDNSDHVQKITDSADPNYTTTYEYDDFNRLEKAYGNAFYRDYDYDPWGNLTNVYAGGGGETGSYTPSYATNATGAPLNNRINNAGYSYDAAGNQTNDGWASATYDAASRLKTVGSNNSCDYDGDGRKVKQVSDGYPLYYLWSSVLGEPVVELDGGGGVYRAYVYGPNGGQMLALLSQDGYFYWQHTDHLGSGRKMTDASGAVRYRAEYDPHGQVLLEVLNGAGSYSNSRKFTGYERDWATNLDYAKARTYTRYRGRFLQPDPLGVGAADVTNPQSLNRYGYVGNDPANFVDPSGLTSEAPIIRIETWERHSVDSWFLWHYLFGWGGSHFVQPIVGEVGGGLDLHIGEPAQQQTGCEAFVDRIVRYSQQQYQTYGAESGQNKVAQALINAPFKSPRSFLDGSPVNYRDEGQITGFKPELTANNQGHDAFRHIQASAGFSMATAGIGGSAMVSLDSAQSIVRGMPGVVVGTHHVKNPFYYPNASLEEITAIKDDLAGIKVGAALVGAFKVGKFDGFGAELRDILCQPR
ncbi:MAG: RHS repeat domain-containing protein [Gammaproteobacteria bacterium]